MCPPQHSGDPFVEVAVDVRAILATVTLALDEIPQLQIDAPEEFVGVSLAFDRSGIPGATIYPAGRGLGYPVIPGRITPVRVTGRAKVALLYEAPAWGGVVADWLVVSSGVEVPLFPQTLRLRLWRRLPSDLVDVTETDRNVCPTGYLMDCGANIVAESPVFAGICGPSTSFQLWATAEGQAWKLGAAVQLNLYPVRTEIGPGRVNRLPLTLPGTAALATLTLTQAANGLNYTVERTTPVTMPASAFLVTVSPVNLVDPTRTALRIGAIARRD